MSIVFLSTPLAALRHDDVDAVEVLAKLGEHLVDAVRHADAGLDRDRAPPKPRISAHKRFGGIGAVVVVDGDVAALGRELARGRAPDPARRARHERHLSRQRCCHRSPSRPARPRAKPLF
jgi:hypothetical protein